MVKPLPPLYGVEDNEEQFEPEQRIVPESFGEGFEWYEHALRLEQHRLEEETRLEQLRLEEETGQDKIEMFFSNEEALVKAIGAHCSIMKYVSIKKPTMLSKDFCFRAYKSTLKKSDEVVGFVVKFIPAEHWSDKAFCTSCLEEAFKANFVEPEELLNIVPPCYWYDLEFCLIMMAASPASLRLMPIMNRNVARRIHHVEWLIFEDELL